jgi:hypothetical protein
MVLALRCVGAGVTTNNASVFEASRDRDPLDGVESALARRTLRCSHFTTPFTSRRLFVLRNLPCNYRV